MSNTTTDEDILVARAIRQALETDVGVGNSVNGTGNTFIVGLVGSFDTLKMAKLILQRLRDHRLAAQEAAAKARIEDLAPAKED
jgi:hypothetical protein